MDKFAVFATWVGIVAFLLAIPMSIAANILTPLIKNWWATTTVLRAKRRLVELDELKMVLEEARKDPLQLTIKIAEPFLDGIRFGIMAILLSVIMAAIGIVRSSASYIPGNRLFLGFAIGAVVCVLGSMLISMLSFQVAIWRTRQLSSETMEKEIKRITEFLVTRQ